MRKLARDFPQDRLGLALLYSMSGLLPDEPIYQIILKACHARPPSESAGKRESKKPHAKQRPNPQAGNPRPEEHHPMEMRLQNALQEAQQQEGQQVRQAARERAERVRQAETEFQRVMTEARRHEDETVQHALQERQEKVRRIGEGMQKAMRDQREAEAQRPAAEREQKEGER